MSNKKLYSKPEFKYWSAAELDAIEAQMSGGGGGGGGGGLRYKWEDYWTSSGVDGDYEMIIGVIVGTLTLIATRNLRLSWQVAGVVTSVLATSFINDNIEKTWWTNEIQHLYMYDGTTGSGYDAWSMVGTAIRTKFYKYSDYTGYIDYQVWCDAPASARYMTNTLRWL